MRTFTPKYRVVHQKVKFKQVHETRHRLQFQVHICLQKLSVFGGRALIVRVYLSISLDHTIN